MFLNVYIFMIFLFLFCLQTIVLIGFTIYNWLLHDSLSQERKETLNAQETIFYLQKEIDEIKIFNKTFHEQTIAELEQRHSAEKKNAVQAALSKSFSINWGQIAEQFVPFAWCEWNPKDYRFVGGVIDYIVFDGLTEGSDIKEIVFLEIKTGQSKLNKRQRAVQNAIDNKRIRFEVINLDSKEITNECNS